MTGKELVEIITRNGLEGARMVIGVQGYTEGEEIYVEIREAGDLLYDDPTRNVCIYDGDGRDFVIIETAADAATIEAFCADYVRRVMSGANDWDYSTIGTLLYDTETHDGEPPAYCEAYGLKWE